MPADDERPVVPEVVAVPEVMAVEVVPVPAEMRAAEMPSATMEATEAAAAAAMDLNGQIIGQDFCLSRSTRNHQRHRLRRDNRRRKRHQPRHSEEAEQSLHL